jgi:hypothetical protein
VLALLLAIRIVDAVRRRMRRSRRSDVMAPA